MAGTAATGNASHAAMSGRVRSRPVNALVTDGPFIETKEHLGG